jgi:hypothetical protein
MADLEFEIWNLESIYGDEIPHPSTNRQGEFQGKK